MPLRYDKKTDANQKDIIKCLSNLGALVFDASKMGRDFPDLIVGHSGITMLAEVKNPEGFNRISSGQQEFMDKWKGNKIRILRTDEDCHALVNYCVLMAEAWEGK